jgi:UDP-N-acetylglucosamine 1-carboxyvinyltransferase
MDRFRILGPCRLHGEIAAEGAKNAALPALAATLLAEEPVTLSRVPLVRDISTMGKLLGHLGVSSERDGSSVHFQPITRPQMDDAPYELVKTMRASVLVLGPLLARLGHARVSLPGGCAIGERPIDQHLAGLEALGAKVVLDHGYVTVTARRLKGARYRFAVPTVTGTENLLMAATLAHGTTILENCAQEPEIRDLAALLSKMGARIQGAGGRDIEIEGVDRLGGAQHSILADRIEAGTYLLAGALTGGELTVRHIEPADLAPLLEKLVECGCEIETGESSISVRQQGPLRPRDMVTAPHPGFPTDLQAQYMALMTGAAGISTICETVFENRFQHVPELRRMGAAIEVEGNRARVEGVSPLSGARVMATDLRASACLVMAGLIADGETIVERIYHLDRGYATMELKLQALGARVERTGGSS